MAYDYSTLIASKSTSGSIANWLNRSDLPVENIIIESESFIYERLRVREMQHRSVMTFAAADQDVALPSGFLDPIGFRPYTWGVDLDFVDFSLLNEYRDSSGTLLTGSPSRWAILGDTAYVDVLPSTAFAGYLTFYRRPDALSIANETNWLTTRYPALLRYACQARAYEHMKDQRSGEYMALAMNAIAEASATNEMWRRAQRV